MLWSLGTLYAMKRAVLPAPALFSTGIQMITGGIAFLVVAILTGEMAGFDPAAVSATSWFGVIYLIVMGGLVAFPTYAWLLTVAPIGRIATYAYVNPVVAVFLGWLILGEPLTTRTVVASVVIVAAVVLIVTARGRVSRGAAARDRRGPTARRCGTGSRDLLSLGRGRSSAPARPAAAGPVGLTGRAPPSARIGCCQPGREKPWAGHGSQRSGRSSR